jgi:hypothetical protein
MESSFPVFCVSRFSRVLLFIFISFCTVAASAQTTTSTFTANQLTDSVIVMKARIKTLERMSVGRDPSNAISDKLKAITKSVDSLHTIISNPPSEAAARANMLASAGPKMMSLYANIDNQERALTGKMAPPAPQSDVVNEVFMTYNPANGRPGSKYFANRTELKKFYDDFDMKQLRTYLDKGRFTVYIPCENIMNIGICIPAGQHTEMEITSALKTVVKNASGEFLNSLRKEISKVVAAANGQSTGTIFIDLYALLNEAYKETAPDFPDCCPDDPSFDAEAATRMKVCHALQLPGGLAVNLFNTASKKSFSLLGFNGGLDSRQSSESNVKLKIEPRQYVTIYEKKKRSSNVEPIWWLIKAADTIRKDRTEAGMFAFQQDFAEKFYPRQMQEAVDMHSTLEIRFDQEEIARNVDFYGNISLAASIGDRKLEVAPYSVIGEARRSLGVNAEPIRKISNNFIRLFIEARRAEAEYDKLRDSQAFRKQLSPEELKRNLLERIGYVNEYYNRVKRTHAGYTDSTKLYNYIPRHIKNNLDNILYYVTNPRLYGYYTSPGNYNFGQLRVALSIARDSVNSAHFARRVNLKDDVFSGEMANKYESFMLSVQRIKEFMHFFNSSGEDSKRAFLNLTSISEIDFNQIYNLVTTDPELTPDSWRDFTSLGETQDDARHKLDQIARALSRLNTFSGELTKMLKSEGYNSLFLNIDFEHEINKATETSKTLIGNSERRALIQDSAQFQTKERYSKENLDALLNNPKYSLLYDYESYRKIREELARRAGGELFSKLVYATIDLRAADVPEGEELKISVMWYNTDGLNSETPDQGIELVTANLLVKKTGWYREFSESALFVDRINENLARQASVSPTNFKAAAGVSMLWTYHNDFRGKGFWGKSWRWLEPSFGLNVSFLDFSDGDAFEFGAGPIIGLWENRVFLVGGYNFNVGGESPLYMGVGFSFMNLFRTKEEKKDDND